MASLRFSTHTILLLFSAFAKILIKLRILTLFKVMICEFNQIHIFVDLQLYAGDYFILNSLNLIKYQTGTWKTGFSILVLDYWLIFINNPWSLGILFILIPYVAPRNGFIIYRRVYALQQLLRSWKKIVSGSKREQPSYG